MTAIATATVPPVAAAELADHLLPLPGGPWAVWRTAALRGAGFPVAEVLRLAPPGAASAADRLLAAEAAAVAVRRELAAEISQALDELRRAGQWEDKRRRRPLLDALRALNQGKLPGGLEPASLDRMRRSQEEQADAGAVFAEAYQQCAIEVSRHIHRLAGWDRLREAIVWQNRRALHTALDELARTPPEAGARNSQRRQHEELVASYLQRYCVKNDSIGFFGPIGWAEIAAGGPAVDCRPGPELLSRRVVYLESWAVEALAKALARNRALRPWMTPRRAPFAHLEGAILHLAEQPAVELPPAHAALLAACDGERTAHDIALDLGRHATQPARREQEVYAQLDYMSRRGLITWGFEVPVQPDAPAVLRRALERIGDEPRRRDALAALAELERERDAVALAAGDAGRLDRALAGMEETFTRLTGEAATRAAGQTYAGRTLVYEDCRRALELRLGDELRDALGPPLSLVLRSARWLTAACAGSFDRAFRQVYEGLVRETGSPVVDCTRFWHRSQPLMVAEGARLVEAVMPELLRRWAEVLRLPAGARRACYRSGELAAPVAAAFAASQPGWRMGRYHNPDVMVAAAGPEAIACGEYQLVLGELHLGVNTLNVWVFMAQHPDFAAVARALDLDMPQPRLVPMAPKFWPTLTTRTQRAHTAARDFQLIAAQHAAGIPGRQAMPIGSLVVRDRDGVLVIETRNGRPAFAVLEVFSELLSYLATSCFQLLAPAAHAPRVTIDRLVVCRETWRCAPEDLTFATERAPDARFLAARRWMRSHGMPRFVFVRAPVEKKPFYVDFESPIYVDLFAKVVRRSLELEAPRGPITIREMLPDPSQAWLPDARGERYTSELRIICIEPEASAAPPDGAGARAALAEG
jgi:Lantibiotic dehydratase, N terminus